MDRATLRATAITAFAVLVVCEVALQQGGGAVGEKLYTQTFRSPAFELGPGDVIDKDLPVPMPPGHIALRSFDAQVVDENRTPIPLFETYLHHWILLRFQIPSKSGLEQDMKLVPNSGVCRSGSLDQWFGLGSETRRTNTTIPPPFGIVIDEPAVGFEDAWILNVHAIDTRGAVDVWGCTECACELYNVTVDGHGRELPADYEGGMDCCHDDTHCPVRAGFMGAKRALFMEYTVTWVDMSDAVVPLRVFLLDVTDTRKAIEDEDDCLVEYTVPKCLEGKSKCIHTAESVAFLPYGGDVVYAVAHQHSGGVGSSLFNEDGGEICTSLPIYGNGTEVANEAGYIVGMTTCYPEPGSVKIRAGEKLKFTSLYNSEERHTGVMGLWYLLVAEPQSQQVHGQATTILARFLVAVTVVAALIFIGVTMWQHMQRRRSGPDYQVVSTL